MSAENSSSRPNSLLIPPQRRARPALEDTEVADPTPPDPVAPTAGDAALLDARARSKRARMEASMDPSSRERLRVEAEELEGEATRLRDPAVFGIPELHLGRGGEVSPLPDNAMPLNMWEVAETVQAPLGILAADATMERLTLARETGVLTLAVEAVESVGAEGAIEQMLVHEMTAAHKITMRLLASAGTELHAHARDRVVGGTRGSLADATRSATAAARLMDSVNRAALALDRLRNGGRQHVTVQHVVVADGGQAVVAGNMSPGDGRTLPGRHRRGGGG